MLWCGRDAPRARPTDVVQHWHIADPCAQERMAYAVVHDWFGLDMHGYISRYMINNAYARSSITTMFGGNAEYFTIPLERQRDVRH